MYKILNTSKSLIMKILKITKMIIISPMEKYQETKHEEPNYY